MINCKIISSQKIILYNKLQDITLPASSGEIQILPQHVESFILLDEGDIVLKKQNGRKETLKVTEGVCHFKNDDLIIVL